MALWSAAGVRAMTDQPMSQWKHSGGIVAETRRRDRALTLIVDGRAVMMVWLVWKD
jgi:hypothetical protein